MRPQFARRTHRARDALELAGRDLPGIWQDYERARLAKPPPAPHIYITEQTGSTAFADAVIRNRGPDALDELRQMSPLGVSRLISPYTTLACWRMTQGIYRIDPALYDALVSTDLAGDIPGDVLMRLPEWCVYIETPGLQLIGRDRKMHDLAGAWVRLDREPSGQDDLIILLDIDGVPLRETHTLPLTSSLAASIETILAEWGQTGPVEAITAYLRPIINLALYLCAGDDISGKHGAPGNPTPKRTRRDGWRLFPADGPRTWDVGVRMGAALRRAYQAEQVAGDTEPTGRTVRAHVRRAHWHGFRSGPRKRPDGTGIPAADRPFDLRWLPPIPVNLDDPGDLPAVIRRVAP